MYGFLLVTCNFELGIGILYDFQILKDIVIVSTVMILIEAMHQQRHPREASRILRDLQHKFQEISLPDLGYLLKNIAKSLRSGCLFAALLMGRRKSHQSSIISKSRMSLVESVNGIGVIHTCIYVHIYVHCIWLTPASFGSRHDLTLVVRSQTKRQQSAHSVKHQGLHSCHN